jgi:hypothetical protein
MVVVFNWLGLLMMVVASGLGSLVVHGFGSANAKASTILASVLLIVIDLGYRSLRKTSLFRRGGGSFMFLPVWIVGIVAVIAAIVSLLRGH